MQIDSEELIKYLESGCNTCKEKDTNWCERCCFVTNAVDSIESFVDTKVNSPKQDLKRQDGNIKEKEEE